MTTKDDRFQGWHPHAIEAQLAKEKKERQARRKAWLKTADTRRIVYRRIVALSTVELIYLVGDLGGGDDYDGCFTKQGQVEFAFAKRTLRKRVRALEADVARMREAWVRAIDADMADDANELGEAIAHASALLDYPRDDDGQDAADDASRRLDLMT